MQRYVILSCKLYCTTFTRSKGRSTSYDFNTHIAWHYATYPYMREYSILARNPCCSLFTRLFGLPLLHVNGGNNIKYNCIKPTHMKGCGILSCNICCAPFMGHVAYPFSKFMGCSINYDFITYNTSHNLLIYARVWYFVSQATMCLFYKVMGHSNSYDCIT